MTHVSIQNMNGTLKHFRGLSKFARLADIEDQQELQGDWSYPRVPEPLKPGEFFTVRRKPEAGELWTSDGTYPVNPMTPSNDERNLPDSMTGQPLKQLPKIDYTTNYPHRYIPYGTVKAYVYPDRPPVPPGWAGAPRRNEKRDAIDLVGPNPWVPEDRQAYDISGFGSIQEVEMAKRLGGMVPIGEEGSGGMSQAEIDAAARAVSQQTAAAAAAGASPSVLDSILNFGAQYAAQQLAANAAQRQAAALTAQANAQAQAAQAQANAAAAQRAALLGSSAGGGSTPFYQNPIVIGGGALALIGLIFALKK